MFDFVRSHTKLLQLLLLIVILPSFVFVGVQGYSSFSEGKAQNVAKVDGQGITQNEWDEAHRQQAERVRRQMPTIDAKLLDSPAARAETLEGLVRERVMLVAAQRAHLTISNDMLERLFKTDSQFASVRNPDGSINKEILAAQGMSSSGFAERLRQDLSVRQVLSAVTDSAVAPNAVVSSALDALLQQREIRYARFDIASYLPKVNPSDAEVEAYYKAHQADFRAPEQATIDYVVLDLETLKKGIAVKDEDLRKYYDENATRYTAAEERRA
ncbi:SurA N-terminal domain-containing protein, partial [Aquabacterium sp.]|uniref:SurA N-terminal domain-containing protein n=1 Tax=Aquabacterium sp. TaxID=1872578 RepID=UPI002B5F9666